MWFIDWSCVHCMCYHDNIGLLSPSSPPPLLLSSLQLLIGYEHNYLELWDALAWKPLSIFGPMKVTFPPLPSLPPFPSLFSYPSLPPLPPPPLPPSQTDDIGELQSVCWHSNGQQFVTSHRNGSIAFWNVGETSAPTMLKTLHGQLVSSNAMNNLPST